MPVHRLSGCNDNTANYITPDSETPKFTIQEAIRQHKKDDGVQSAFESIQPVIKRDSWRLSPSDRYFVDYSKAVKWNMPLPDRSDPKYIDPVPSVLNQDLCPY